MQAAAMSARNRTTILWVDDHPDCRMLVLDAIADVCGDTDVREVGSVTDASEFLRAVRKSVQYWLYVHRFPAGASAA